MTQNLKKKKRPNVNYKQPDLYDYHKALNPESQLTYLQYSTIIKRFNEAIVNHLLSGRDFKMPFNLGKLCIRKKQIYITEEKRYMKIDFQATKKAGKVVYYLNDHSNNFYARFVWLRGNLLHRSYYQFTPARGPKRMLAKKMIAGQDYLEL